MVVRRSEWGIAFIGGQQTHTTHRLTDTLASEAHAKRDDVCRHTRRQKTECAPLTSTCPRSLSICLLYTNNRPTAHVVSISMPICMLGDIVCQILLAASHWYRPECMKSCYLYKIVRYASYRGPLIRHLTDGWRMSGVLKGLPIIMREVIKCACIVKNSFN